MSARIARRRFLVGTAGTVVASVAPTLAFAQQRPVMRRLLTEKTGSLAQDGIQIEQGSVRWWNPRALAHRAPRYAEGIALATDQPRRWIMVGFFIGTLIGSAAAYVWHDKIRSYIDTQFPAMRERAAEQIGTIGQRAGDALDQAKSRLDSTVRSSQERLRAAGRSGPVAGPRSDSQDTSG